MSTRSVIRNLLGGVCDEHPTLKRRLQAIDKGIDRLHGAFVSHFPQFIRPEPRKIYLTLTANCNLRCKGCRYGRDFMPGEQLSLPMVKQVLDDVKAHDFDTVRLYGGEPLMHRHITDIVEYCSRIGVRSYMTTNGILLRRKIDDLFAAGLRRVSVGSYGVGDAYDTYVQRKDRFRVLEESLGYVRDTYGERITMGLNWLLMRPTCSVESVHEIWDFARRFDMPIYINLVHYSLPYFTEGEDRELQFKAGDRAAIERVVGEFLKLQRREPDLLPMSPVALRSIPDWLLKGPDMRVPCDRHRLIWVGADGTVQMCYTAFKLGNLHEKRLSEMLFTEEHVKAARDAFALNCPNCHCGYPSRTATYAAHRYRHWRPSQA